MEVYETLPIVPLRDVVVFPHMMMPFVIGRPSSTRALEHALVVDLEIPGPVTVDADVGRFGQLLEVGAKSRGHAE